jgi:cupin 2 domain-containing protein
MDLDAGNLFENLPERFAREQVIELLTAPNVVIERIVSTGQASPPGFWYDQEWNEWVILVAGGAQLLFEGEDSPRAMNPGDYIHIPKHARHRLESTDPEQPTVWLAVHYR